jgi:hypothetical protein
MIGEQARTLKEVVVASSIAWDIEEKHKNVRQVYPKPGRESKCGTFRIQKPV